MSKGLFHIKVVEATDIPKMDLFGKADPYCILRFNDKKKCRTKTIDNTYKPVWNEEFHFEIEDLMTDHLVILIKDEDTGKSDDPISKLVLNLADFEPNTVIEKWFSAVPVKGVKKGGKIRLKIHISTNGSAAFTESSPVGPATNTMSGLAGNMQMFTQNVVQMARHQQEAEKKLEQEKQGFYNSIEMQRAQMPPGMYPQQMQDPNMQQQVIIQNQAPVQPQMVPPPQEMQQQVPMGMMQNAPPNMGMVQQCQPQVGMMPMPQQQQQIGLMQNPQNSQMGMMQMPQANVCYPQQQMGMMAQPQYGMMNQQMAQQPQYGMMMGAPQQAPYGMMPQQPGMMMAPQTNMGYMQQPQYPGQVQPHQQPGMYPGQIRRY